MPRKPSAETELKRVKRDFRRLDAQYARQLSNNTQLFQELTKAKQEINEWKRRFDALLERTPEALERDG